MPRPIPQIHTTGDAVLDIFAQSIAYAFYRADAGNEQEAALLVVLFGLPRLMHLYKIGLIKWDPETAFMEAGNAAE